MTTSSQNEPGTQAEAKSTGFYDGIDPQRYEITWLSGHVETVIAHQVSWPNNAANIFAGGSKPQRIQFHAEVGGRWTLQLSALEEDLRTIRNITNGEHVLPEGGAL